MTHRPPVVVLQQVRRSFSGTPEVHAVRDVDLTIERGDYVSIVGPSGSGKSSLLHLIGLLDRPTAGTYRLDGLETTALSERARAGLRGQRLGFVFQSFHLMAHRTVLENVMLAMVHNGTPRAERQGRAEAALDDVGMTHRLTFSPTTLSGGERQRVAIARALVTRPALLLADEPTGNLDSVSSAAVLDLFDRLHADGLTVAVITHDAAVSRRASRRVQIVDGLLRAVA